MKNGFLFSSLTALSMLVAAPVFAQNRDANTVELSSDVKVVKTVQQEGGEAKVELVDPDVVVPGDKLIFRSEYKNSGTETATNFVVNNAINPAVMLAADNDPSLLVSVDGGNEFGPLSTLIVTSDDGTTRAAQAGDVTNVRWILEEVKPGEAGKISFYAIVR